MNQQEEKLTALLREIGGNSHWVTWSAKFTCEELAEKLIARGACGGEPHGLPGEPSDDVIFAAYLAMTGQQRRSIHPMLKGYAKQTKGWRHAANIVRAAYAVDRASGAATHGEREALLAAQEWAAGFPLGGGMDEIAAREVLAKCEAALSASPALGDGPRG